MGVYFTPFEAILIAIGVFWPASLLIVALLLWLAIARPGWPRYIASPAAVVLILILICDGLFALGAKNDRIQREADEAATKRRLTVTLKQDTFVPQASYTTQNTTGMLAAGSTVEWVDDAHDGFYWVHLSRPARFIGVDWQDDLSSDAQGFWTGTLARDQSFSDWHCRKGGKAEFDISNTLMSCIMARDYIAANQTFPAGLESSIIDGIEFTVPEGSVLYLSDVGITLTPHQTVKLDSSGRVGQINLNPFNEFKPDPEVRFRGVPIHSSFTYAYTGDDSKRLLVGINMQLDEPLSCGPRTLEGSTKVILPLAGNTVIASREGAPIEEIPGCQLQP